MKLKRSFPWLVRYPFERAANYWGQTTFEKKHYIFTIANHFEPAWSSGGKVDVRTQRERLKKWQKTAKKTGELLQDANGTKFQHTYFFPIEQYDKVQLDILSEMQADGLGETEIHLHHGVEKPDTSENLRRVLLESRDCFAEEHRFLSRWNGKGEPRYAFVHGNLALGNSCGGRFCGVDDEVQILAETGCYADFTLPSAPDETQVPVINKIYECGLPLTEKIPHRRGKPVRVGQSEVKFPLIFQGPLILKWTRKLYGLSLPRIEDGALTQNQGLDPERFRYWKNANITVKNRTDWVFIKLYCHGFFDGEESFCIGDEARRFFDEIIEKGEKSGEYRIYFASAREAVNMVLAAIDGKKGTPDQFRDYRLKKIM